MKLTELLTDVMYHTALDDIEIADVTWRFQKSKTGQFVCLYCR